MSGTKIAIFVLAAIFIYLCVYSIVNRICECIENCAKAKVYDRCFGSEITKINESEKSKNEVILDKSSEKIE